MPSAPLAQLEPLGETMLTVLTDAALTGKQRAIAFRGMLGYVLGALQSNTARRCPVRAPAALAALPPEEFPILSETAAQAQAIRAEQEFREGFGILQRGLDL